MPLSLSAFQNLDLLSVGIAVAGMSVLGFVVLFNNFKSISQRIFFLLAMCASAWGIVNYAFYQPQVSIELSLWLLRFVMFFGVWASFLTFMFAYLFPEEKASLPWHYKWIFIPLTTATSLLTLTPYVFADITAKTATGNISAVINGMGIVVFGLVVMFLNIGSIVLLIRKIIATDKKQRAPLEIVLFGVAVMLLLIITFNFLLPAFFSNSQFIPLGALFLFPFVAFTAYAILKFGFFNVKVAGVAALVFALSVAMFGEIIFTTTLPLIIFRTSIFLLVLISGINLIRGVLREVEQREKIQILANELQDTNERQEGLIHFIGHEVKGSLTKDMGAFASLSEGDFGILPEAQKNFIDQAFAESRQGADAVANILKASNLKKGTVQYTKEPFDLKALVIGAVERAKAAAQLKGLALSFTADESLYQMTGDKTQINDHVLRNLIDNAINYTPSGSVAISLKKEGAKFVFAVKDSGVGITDEDKKRLFTEGGHGKDSQTINVHSTGYGLYIAKSIVLAHNGTIRAESEGAGKGSTFIVEVPVTF